MLLRQLSKVAGGSTFPCGHATVGPLHCLRLFMAATSEQLFRHRIFSSTALGVACTASSGEGKTGISGQSTVENVPLESCVAKPKRQKQVDVPPQLPTIRNWRHLMDQLNHTQRVEQNVPYVENVVIQLKKIVPQLRRFDLACLSQDVGRAAAITTSRDVNLLLVGVLDVVASGFKEFGAESFELIGLCRLLSGFAHAEHKVSEELADSIARVLIQQRGIMSPRQWAINAWHFGKLDLNPLNGNYFDVMTEAALLHIGHLEPQDISNIVWSFAKLELTPSNDRFLDYLVDAALDKLCKFEPQHISNTIWGLATLKHRPSNECFLDCLADAALNKLHMFDPQAISNTIWGLATLKHRPSNERFLDCLADAAADTLRMFEPQGISNTIWGFATLKHRPSNDRFLDIVVKVAFEKFHMFNPRDISNTIWGFAALGLTLSDDRFFDYLMDVILDKIHMFEIRQICNTIWALVSLSYTPTDEQFLATMVKRVNMHIGLGDSLNLEDKVQLYQAHLYFHTVGKMSCSSEWLSDEVVTMCATAFHNCKTKTTKPQVEVYELLSQLGLRCMLEAKLGGHVMTPDIAILRNYKVAVEFDGPHHYTSNKPFREDGRTILRNKLLAMDGWQVVTVPYFEWGSLQSRNDKIVYLLQKLQTVVL